MPTLWSMPFSKKNYDAAAIEENYAQNENGQGYVLMQLPADDYPTIIEKPYILELNQQRDYYRQEQCLVTADAQPDYHEMYAFYTHSGNSKVLAGMSENAELLKTFAEYFKASAADIIKLADANRFFCPAASSLSTDDDSAHQIENVQLSGIDKLTDREIEIVNILMQGKTGVEIGKDLHISRRTVERHIENIKEKIHCRTKSEVIQFFYNKKLNVQNKVSSK